MDVRHVVRWLTISIGIVLMIAALAAAGIYALSARRLNRVYDVNVVVPRAMPTDAAAVERGRHIATALASCTMCHGADLGGQMLAEQGPLGILVAPNLTRGRGGLGAMFTDVDWVRGIRHGVHGDGTTLLAMPTEAFVYMNEGDVADLIAYLKQVPGVDRVMPPSRLGPLGRTLLVAGKFSILVAEKTPRIGYPAAIPPAPTVEYGRYLANFTGCHGCHGFGLSGGEVAGPPGTPPASNLTADPATGIARWTETDFERALRHGVTPDGRQLNIFMPWPYFAGLTDTEVRALWSYLRSVPAKPFGNK
jgi:mono/diheme cytochrome c family protein